MDTCEHMQETRELPLPVVNADTVSDYHNSGVHSLLWTRSWMRSWCLKETSNNKKKELSNLLNALQLGKARFYLLVSITVALLSPLLDFKLAMELPSKEQTLIERLRSGGSFWSTAAAKKRTACQSAQRAPQTAPSQHASGSSGMIRVTEDPSDGIRQ